MNNKKTAALMGHGGIIKVQRPPLDTSYSAQSESTSELSYYALQFVILRVTKEIRSIRDCVKYGSTEYFVTSSNFPCDTWKSNRIR